MRYLIIGNGAAGNAAAEAIRRGDPSGEVVILSDESHASYYRPLLPLYLENKLASGALFRGPLHFAPGVIVQLGRPVKRIDPQRKVVALGSGEEMSYDRLLLAAGSTPALPPVANLPGEGMFVLRKLSDADAIRRGVHNAKKAVVIGGGRIGVKSAIALRLMGLEVTIVEMLPRLIPLQLDEPAGEIVARVVKGLGISLLLGDTAQEVVRERRGFWARLFGQRQERLRAVVTGGGQRLEADLIVAAVGVRANTELAAAAGASVRNGVVVDESLRTSLPDIYAAGDVVETVDLTTGEPMVSGTWTNAVNMGHIAGENMAGGKRRFAGALNVYNAMEVSGLPVISAGVVNPGDGYEVHTSGHGDDYRKLVFKDNRLVGLLLVGEAIAGAGVYGAFIREGTDIGKIKGDLIAGTFGYARELTPKEAVLDTYAR